MTGSKHHRAARADGALYAWPGAPQQTRWFTYENQQGLKGEGGKANHSRKGAPSIAIQPGQTHVLADIEGPGTIRRIWATIRNLSSPEALRGIKIEMFWDGAETPAVAAPFGDFFGHTLGKMVTFENALFSSPEGKSFNCVVPMPFRTSARIQVTNETDQLQEMFYEVNATLGDAHGDDAMYLHAHWRRENPTEPRRDMTILPHIEGRGRFLGCLLGMRQGAAWVDTWFGEGEVKIYLDGDADAPTLCGTGTEDFIGTGWGQNRFDTLYQGNPYVSDTGDGMFKDAQGFYRFHVPDPVWFHENIRVTIQCLGGATGESLLKAWVRDPDLRVVAAGDGSNELTREWAEANPEAFVVVERTDDYSAMAYWYQAAPTHDLPPLADVADRVRDLP